MRSLIAIVLCAAGLLAPPAGRQPEVVPSDEQQALDHISADSMRGHLSFLASDALEGRGTPSRGLDIAAEYIAAQFRRAGLEPAAPDGSYFQIAHFSNVSPKLDDLRFTLEADGRLFTLGKADLRIKTPTALDLKDATVVKLPADYSKVDLAGKVVVDDIKRYSSQTAIASLTTKMPALVLLLDKRKLRRRITYLEEAGVEKCPVIAIDNPEAVSALEKATRATVSVHVSAPAKADLPLRNVAAVLRGSDPVLRDQFVILSAHYDHLGTKTQGSGDRIYNGANDDGSGTVSVIEIAESLSKLPTHPKRSILFIAFFGEERGLLGSNFYVQHPLVPLNKTVADINLEQMGRTDEQDGKEVDAFAFTGPSYSTLPSTLAEAAKSQAVRAYQKNGADQFFDRSDNLAFAEAGVIAHTLVVAFEFPDYHGVGDEWQKIDYANMARVDKGVAAGLLKVANGLEPPAWSNTDAARKYRSAAQGGP